MSRIYTTQSTLNQFAFILVAIRQLSAADLITDLFYEQLPKYESLPHEIQCNAKCEQKYVAGETLMSLQQHFNQRIMNNNNNRKLLELELIYNIHQNESILDLSFCQTFIHFIGKQLFISSKKSNQLLPSYMNKSSDIIGLNMTDYLCNLHINKCVICNENDGCFIQCSHNNCHIKYHVQHDITDLQCGGNELDQSHHSSTLLTFVMAPPNAKLTPIPTPTPKKLGHARLTWNAANKNEQENEMDDDEESDEEYIFTPASMKFVLVFGILMATLVIVILIGGVEIPIYVAAGAGLCVAIGFALFGAPVLETIGKSITRLSYRSGFAAQFCAAVTVLACNVLGLPVSTSTTVVGAISGVGLYNSKHNKQNKKEKEDNKKYKNDDELLDDGHCPNLNGNTLRVSGLNGPLFKRSEIHSSGHLKGWLLVFLW